MRIAILTAFSYFHPGYSLTGIVRDQAAMLAAYGHEVTVHVQERANLEGCGILDVIPDIPFSTLADYQCLTEVSQDHQAIAERTMAVLNDILPDTDIVITHDWALTGWNLPYLLGAINAGRFRLRTKWLHWIHSIPSQARDWWFLEAWGDNHHLVYPNRTDAWRVQRAYQAPERRVHAIPHIKDPRTWGGFSAITGRLIEAHPGLLSAEIVQILPAGQDRLKWKRVPEVLAVFGEFKRRGRSAFLLVANQWASQTTYQRDLEDYRKLAREHGLDYGADWTFSSDFETPDFENGLTQDVIRQLFSLSNLFVFGTHHESFGLVVPEAALEGVLFVGNGSLSQQLEVAGGPGAGLWAEFGSYERGGGTWTPHRTSALADDILSEFDRNPVIRFKTHARQTYNRDAIYRRFYEPLLMGLAS